MGGYAKVAVKTLKGSFMYHALVANRAEYEPKKNIENRVSAYSVPKKTGQFCLPSASLASAFDVGCKWAQTAIRGFGDHRGHINLYLVAFYGRGGRMTAKFKLILRHISVIFCLSLFIVQAHAAVNTLPSSAAAVEGSNSEQTSLGASSNTAQVVYGESLLIAADIQVGDQITGLAFRVN
ncbi:MAG: hypothetical protein P8M13_06005 [Luminiphilus sp.]|nr:hypothetical protein [Luminiphilus sp.]